MQVLHRLEMESVEITLCGVSVQTLNFKRADQASSGTKKGP